MNHSKELQKELALWIIRLNADDPHERAQARTEFEHWKIQHPEALEQIDQFNQFVEEMQQLSVTHHLSSKTIQNSLKVSQQSRQHIQKIFGQSFLSMTTLGLLGYVLYTYFPYAYYGADFKTSTGEMQSFVLEDGSRITLGAKSAIKLDFDHQQRRIELVQGDIFVDVAKDTSRPFIVSSDQADFKALGTRFIIHKYLEHSSLSMLHSKVEVISHHTGGYHKIVQEGQRIEADQQGLSELENIQIASTELAWQRQQILANELTLPDLLDRLNRSHQAYLFFNSASLQHFKINGVINTRQNLEQILSLITAQYPEIRISKLGNHVFIIRAP